MYEGCVGKYYYIYFNNFSHRTDNDNLRKTNVRLWDSPGWKKRFARRVPNAKFLKLKRAECRELHCEVQDYWVFGLCLVF
jgi:hypothetical protein